ncbi:MAG: hypothetical protein M1269_04765, partial [Chloroflexi bacterium]|nr:hypothetical protein [Chloroflexota bacterium]
EDEYCSFVKSARWLPKILQLISICHTQALKEIFYKNIKPGKNLENVSKDIPAPVPVSTVPDILGIYNYI